MRWRNCRTNNDSPVPDSLLPSLQLRDLVHLEPIDPRSVALRLDSDTRCVDALASALRRNSYLRLVLHAPPRTRIARCAVLTHDRRGIVAVLSRDEGRVHEVEQVRKGGAEVCAVDRAVARGFGRVQVFAAAAEELDGLLIWDVGEPDGKERLRGAKDTWAPTEVGALVFVELGGDK